MDCCGTLCQVESTESTFNYCPDDPKALLSPVKRDRSCTDFGFFIFLAVFISFLIISTIVVGAKSNPRRLIYGYDDYGNLCGIKNQPIEGVERSGMDYTSKRYLLIKRMCFNHSCNFKKTCYNKCPENVQEWSDRRCQNGTERQMESQYLLELSDLKKAVSDIGTCWQEIFISCLISIALSACLLGIFRCCGAFIIYGVIGFTIIAVIIWAISMWVVCYLQIRKSELNRIDDTLLYWQVIAITTIIMVLFLTCLFCMRKNITFAVALFEEAGKYIADMPLLLVQPIVTSTSIALTWYFLILSIVWVLSSGEPTVDSRGIVSFPINTFFKIVGCCSLFGSMWMVMFILACQHVSVAGAVGLWYFTKDKNILNETPNPVSISWRNLVCYHLGSTAFGSFVVAVLNFLRALLNSNRQRSEECRCYVLCFSWSLAGLVVFLNFLFRDAYIMIAIFGESFCTSARRAYNMFTSNVKSVATVETVGELIFVLGNTGIMVLVAIISFTLVKPIEGVNFIGVPMTISCAFAFLCSHCFLSVYRVTMDTLMVCFFEDRQMNDGVDKPYFMNKSFMVFMEKRLNLETTAERSV